MRIPRRGVIAQNKGGGFVWAVYTTAPGVDESVYTTGSFTMTKSTFGSAPTLMAADGYTVSSSGTISLTGAVSTSVANLASGKYIVSTSSSSSTTTTSTQYVYKVTGVTSSGSWTVTYTVSYERYEIDHNAKGTDTGERVESSDGTAYPHYGAQGDYFYVLLRGITTAHVWDVYNVKQSTSYTYKESKTNYTSSSSVTVKSPMYYSTKYTFDASTGKYTLVSPTETTTCQTTNFKNYWMASGYSGSTMYQNYTTVTPSTRQVVPQYKYSASVDTATTTYSKGSSTGTFVQSLDKNAYPQDGKQDSYWYVYTGTEEVYIDNT